MEVLFLISSLSKASKKFTSLTFQTRAKGEKSARISIYKSDPKIPIPGAFQE